MSKTPGSLEDLLKSIQSINEVTADLRDQMRVDRLVKLQISKDMAVVYQQSLDDIAKVAARLCDTDTGLITFIDGEYAFVKAGVFEDTPGFVTPKKDSFCTTTIQQDDVFIVEDSSQCEALQASRYAKDSMFYAGAPIKVDGVAIGAVCVVDYNPRKVEDASKYQALMNLARLASDVLSNKGR